MNRRQRGAHLLEFSLVAGVFFLVFFGILEFSRMIFTWSTLTEATRRGARVAAVCPVDHAAVARVTISGDSGGDGPVLPNLTTANVLVQYFDTDGVVIPNPAVSAGDVAFVSVQINGYQHQFLVPYIPTIFSAPSFRAVLPSESLGAVPTPLGVAPVAAQCYGTTS